jgi:uncharacterized protein (DUF58 family)
MTPPNIKRNRIRYAVLLVLALVLRGQGTGVVHSLPLRLLVALPVLSGAMLLAAWFRIRLSQSVDSYYPVAGGAAAISVKVENPARVPLPYIGLAWSDNPHVFGAAPPDEWLPLAPRAVKELRVDRPCRYRGRYEAGLTSLTAADVCGLFRLTRTVPPLYVAVRPRLCPLPPIPAGSARGFEEGAAAHLEARRGELYDITGYQPGQPMMNIHWKLSAKTGEWMVGRYRSSSAPGCVLFLDTTLPPGWSDWLRIQTADTLASAALSYGARYLEGGWQVAFLTGGDASVDLTEPDDVLTLAQSLAELPFYHTADELPSFQYFANQQTGQALVSVLVITRHITPDLAARLCELAGHGSEVTAYTLENTPADVLEPLRAAGVSIWHPEDAE